MIPVLYAQETTDFTRNGEGFLTECIKCLVTEERNGSYELTMQYPITGRLFKKLTEGAIIKAKANETSALQLFRVYYSSKPLKGIVTYKAEHISYDLNGLPVPGISALNTTPQVAIQRAFDSSPLSCPFSAISDISTLNSLKFAEPLSARAILGGREGSVLDVWGGEYEFDNFTVKLHAHRGDNNGVLIEYGKNLTDISQEKNIAECYTHLFPYVIIPATEESGEDQYLFLTERVISLPAAEFFGHSKAYIMDFSDRFGETEEKTEERLRAKATSFANTTELGTPKVNITVSFVQLWQTEEYKNIAPLERVKLCDTVTVRFSKLSIDATAKVIKTVYDSIREKYESVSIGEARSSFADTVIKQNAAIAAVENTVRRGQAQASQELAEAIRRATNLITGQSGGYVVLNPAEMPQEILILDAPTIEEAVNVWRWNSAGLGHSSTGYNGAYSLAMTMDGSIVADFVTAGALNGNLLRADSVLSSAISQHYKAEVTNEIGEAREATEQAFKAADGQLLSQITSVTDNLDAEYNGLLRTVSTLQQTIEALVLSYSTETTGGVNHVRNSSGLNGVSDDWSYTGSVLAMQTADAINNTAAGSYFRINAGTLSQEVAVLQGRTYTLTFAAKRDTANRCFLRINNGGNEEYVFDTQAAPSGWEAYSLTFTAAASSISLEIGTTGQYLYIGDIMIGEGTAKTAWQPAPNEIYTTNVKIDRRGINITNEDSATETVIDNTQFAVKHNGNTVLTVNKDLTTLQKTEVTDELTVGKGKFVPVSNGLDFVLLD